MHMTTSLSNAYNFFILGFLGLPGFLKKAGPHPCLIVTSFIRIRINQQIDMRH